MTNLSITTVKSEDDIIESFIRYNATFIDIFIVIDNNSSDKTREILLKLQKDGFNIIIFDDPVLGRFESKKMTFYYRRVVPIFRPDVVFLLDADEFIVAPSRDYIDDITSNLQKGSVALIPWRTYVLTQENAAKGVYDPLKEIQHRRIVENPLYYKAVISVSKEYDETLVIEAGNHSCHLEDNKPLLTNIVTDIFIAHYPLRNHQQMLSKVILGWFENIIKNRFQTWQGYGFHKKYLYDRYLKNYSISDEELSDESLYYAQDRSLSRPFSELISHEPLPSDYNLIYTDKVISPAIHKIILGFDRILSENPALSFNVSNDAELLQQNIWVDLPPFRYILEKYSINSVLAVGHSYWSCLHFDDIVSSEIQDSTKKINLQKQFDLVICNDLATYNSVEYADILIENILTHAKRYIIISPFPKDDLNYLSADNLMLSAYLEKFSNKGWHPCLIDSLAMRSLASFSCFRQGLIVLMPANKIEHNLQILVKKNDQIQTSPWLKAGVITHPMQFFLSNHPEIAEAQIFSKNLQQQIIKDQKLHLLEMRSLLSAKEQELRDIYTSKTWKLIVKPVHLFKSKIRNMLNFCSSSPSSVQMSRHPREREDPETIRKYHGQT